MTAPDLTAPDLTAPDLTAPELAGLRVPREGEEPVFAEPWQAHAFALVVQLHRQGAFAWPEWAQALGEQVKAAGPQDDGSRYYEHWLAALERLVTAKRLSDRDALADRRRAWEAAYRRTPHGKPVTL